MSRFFIVPIPVRVRIKQVKPRIKRHRLRRILRLLLVMAVIGLIAQNWKFFLILATVLAALWIAIWFFRNRATPRHGSLRSSEPVFDEIQPSPPPLHEQFSTGVRGLARAFTEGIRNGRGQG